MTMTEHDDGSPEEIVQVECYHCGYNIETNPSNSILMCPNCKMVGLGSRRDSRSGDKAGEVADR